MAVSRDFRDAYSPFLTGETETFATVLVAGLLRMYGSEALNWDGETIRLELQRDLDVEPPRVVYDQMMGLISALTSSLVYSDVPTFDQTINSLNRVGVSDQDDIPTVDELAWTVTELMLNDPPEEGVQFDKDIERYCRVVLMDEGYRIPPRVLSWVELPKMASEFHTNPDMYQAVWANHEAMAKATDDAMQARLDLLVSHLSHIGVRNAAAQS